MQEIKQIGQKPKISGNQALNFLTNNFDVSNHMCEDTLTNAWNKHIDKLATNKMTMESLAMLNDLSVSIAQLKNILFNLVVAIPLHVPPSAAITRESVQKCIDDWLEYDDKIAALLDLSVLELSLIIAIKHHSEIYERGPFNFEMILTRYHKFLNSIENRKENHDRTLVLKAFEVLKVSTGLLLKSDDKHERKYHYIISLITECRCHRASQCIIQRAERVSNVSAIALLQSNQ